MKLWSQSFLALALLSSQAWADPLKEIYPFKPYGLDEVNEKVSKVTEEHRPLMNVYEMASRKLDVRKTKNQPWMGYYWALNQGQIANTWQDKNYLEFWKLLTWETNVNSWKKRRVQHLPNVMEMDEKDLAKLAPSEKYDLMMGDMSFDLTHRVWSFVETWGNQKKWGFLSSIDLPNGFRIPKASRNMALWEGICHGWALAAGAYPRPEKIVNFTLPNGKTLPFYPDDIKALISLLFANSTLQDNVLVEGYRCNTKTPKQDEFGRFIDEMPKKEGEPLLPRCADVHPAVWHASIVNIMGIQGRSLVVEIDANATVNNHPMSGYKFKWFNPATGREGDLDKSIIDLSTYDDPYKGNRSSHATKLVGVEMEMEILSWVNPKVKESESDADDKFDTQKFMYDLELDNQGNIVGGQWRASKKAELFDSNAGSRRAGGTTRQSPPRVKQPDFFWVTPKNYMMYFKNLNLERWSGRGALPQSWKNASKSAHAFTYNVTREFGFEEKCTVIPERGRGSQEVPCEFKYPRPQPMINFVNKLVEMSKE